MTPEQVIEEVQRSGLRGRGGAGFATALKWQTCRNSSCGEKYIICNAHESDLDSRAVATLLEGDPYTVLEGMSIAAYAAGASKGYIYVRKDLKPAIEKLHKALAEMKEHSLLGASIINTVFSFDIEIYEAETDFVYGEETIMLRAMEGKREVAYPRPPYPAVSGLNKKPTVINSVETLANVAVIMQKGAAWFTDYGTAGSKGTKVLTLRGKVKNPGVVEVPLGTTLRNIIYGIGDGMADGVPLTGVQVGGPTGGILPAAALDTPFDYEDLIEAGGIMGSSVITVLDSDVCMVDKAVQLMTFNRSASCGGCVLCREGTFQMQEMLKKIYEGKGEAKDIDILQELGEGMKSGSLCGFGKTAPNPVLTTIRYFREEYESHIKDGKCLSR